MPEGPSSGGERWRRALVAVGPPLAFFLAARALFSVSALQAGQPPLESGAWAKWDSAHYLSIAERGYEYIRCGDAHVGNYPLDAWCGNAGWSPGYPLMIRLLAAVGISPPAAGAALSALFALGILLVLWNLFLEAKLELRNFLCLGAAAFFPGAVFQHAVFPISACLFFVLLALYCADRRRWAIAGALGGAAAFTYSTGFLLGGVLGLQALLFPARPGWRERWIPALTAGALVGVGLLAMMTMHRVGVGAWDAFFESQRKYGHGLNAPWGPFSFIVVHSFDPGYFSRVAAGVQMIFVAAAWIPAAVAGALWRPRVPRDVGLLLYTGIYSLFPLVVGGQIATYRAEALLLPAVLLARKLPLVVQLALTLGCVALAYPVASLFFGAKLV